MRQQSLRPKLKSATSKQPARYRKPSRSTHGLVNEQAAPPFISRIDGRRVSSKHLDIDFQRKCQCPPTHINCMTTKEWMKSQLGVWQFFYEKRDIGNP